MKNILCFILIMLLSINLIVQIKLDKIKSENFNEFRELDTLDVFIINDITNPVFKYSNFPPGANDKNFNFELYRIIRIKVNRFKDYKEKSLLIYQSEFSCEKTKIKDITVIEFYSENNKIIKNKLSPKLIRTINKDKTIYLDLSDVKFMDNSIIDFEIKLTDLPTKNIIWNFDQKYYHAKCEFIMDLPQIYEYDINKISANDYNINFMNDELQGEFVGYRVFGLNNGTGSDLISAEDAKRYRFKPESLNSVYYKLRKFHYSVTNLSSDDTKKKDLLIIFNVKSINPIK